MGHGRFCIPFIHLDETWGEKVVGIIWMQPFVSVLYGRDHCQRLTGSIGGGRDHLKVTLGAGVG